MRRGGRTMDKVIGEMRVHKMRGEKAREREGREHGVDSGECVCVWSSKSTLQELRKGSG